MEPLQLKRFGTAPGGAPYKVVLVTNPWPDTIPNETLLDILEGAIMVRATDVLTRHITGTYEHDSMGFTVLNPTAAIWTPSHEAVLAVAAIGEQVRATRCITNAAAKTCAHRDHGEEAGHLVYCREYCLADGDFEWAFSALLEGIYGGSSGASELQDRHQIYKLLNDLVYELAMARAAWREQHGGRKGWLSNNRKPAKKYEDIAGLIAA